ncbi:hypothetical protein GCK72_010973 [Caenorhabditis remanei]|uniref:Uncharacterized protein n=1 Tax=Caenorhabditis remanei TaxID=31234 RepID=A0A6A5H742_CAERE|nr:hypothetical protein GCK72_010973 [Caenorhabditis remanei]KAF1762711.1 hypothetical protein GCK72_010973 [Caenorhabditis remanei]
MDELVKVMEEFDIDKDLITVVSDMSFEMSSRQLHKDGCTPITFISYDCQPVMFTGQALLYIFHTAVCGVNWKIKRDIGEYVQMLRSLILEYSEMDQNLLILKRTVLEDITKLLTHRPLELKPLPLEGAADYKLQIFCHEKQISGIDYSRTCEMYGLDTLVDNPKYENEPFPFMLTRENYYMGFVNSFFKSEYSGIKKRLRDEFLWKTDKSLRTSFYQCMTNVCEIDNLNLEKPGTNRNGEEETSHMNSAMRPAEQLIKRKEAKIKTEENSVQRRSEDFASTSGNYVIGRSSAEEKTKETIKEMEETFLKLMGKLGIKLWSDECSGEEYEDESYTESEPESDTLDQKITEKRQTNLMKSSPNEESSRAKTPAEESSGSLESSQERDLAVKKAERFEEKAKKYDELEVKFKEMKKEKEQLERKIATQVKHSDENERLRARISSRQDIEKQLRASRNEHQQKAESLLEENTRLFKQSEEDKIKVVEMRRKLEEAKGKTREVNKEWSTRNEELNKDVVRLNGVIKKKE